MGFQNQARLLKTAATETLSYDFHGLLSLEINRPKFREWVQDINQPFSYFRTNGTGSPPDVVLNIGPFEPQNNHCDQVDHRFLVKENYFYCMEFVDKIRCQCEIIGLDEGPTVINVDSELKNFRQLLLPSLIAQNIFLRPLLDYKFHQKGILSIHALGVAKHDNAFIFSGRGGAHKTTFAMDLIRDHGYQFQGEDRLLLNPKTRTVYAYPIHEQLFRYRLAQMATEDYSRLDKVRFLYEQFRGQEPKSYIANQAQLAGISSIVKYNGDAMSREEVSPRSLARKIRSSQQMESLSSPVIMKMSAGRIYEYFAAYAFKFPASQVAKYWASYEQMLEQVLEEETSNEFYLPEQYTRGLTQNLVDYMEAIEKR